MCVIIMVEIYNRQSWSTGSLHANFGTSNIRIKARWRDSRKWAGVSCARATTNSAFHGCLKSASELQNLCATQLFSLKLLFIAPIRVKQHCMVNLHCFVCVLLYLQRSSLADGFVQTWWRRLQQRQPSVLLPYQTSHHDESDILIGNFLAERGEKCESIAHTNTQWKES